MHCLKLFQYSFVLFIDYESERGITDFSFPRPFVPKNVRSLWRTFVPQERKFQELSFPGPFVPGNFRSPGTKVPWYFRSQALSFSVTFVLGERKFLGTFVPGTFRTRELSFLLSDRPIVAALRCVLNYCMFGCDFTRMMLTDSIVNFSANVVRSSTCFRRPSVCV